jgi:ATP-dependent DNA helicase Rep
LYRGNHQAKLFEKSLREHKIPYFVSGGTSFFSRAEVKDIMAYLRLLANPDDDAAFLRAVNTPRREIGSSTLEKLGNYAQERKVSLYTACFELGLAQHLPERTVDRVQHFAHWLADLSDRAGRGADPAGLCRELVQTIDYATWLLDTCNDSRTAERRMENVNELIEWIQKMAETSAEYKTLPDLVRYLTLVDILERQEEDKPADRVALMTLHAAKGLEFSHVFLVGMEEDLLPHANSQDEFGIQEERRLAYVGITRARKSLTFSLASRRRRYGEDKECQPSRFLEELPSEDLTWEGRAAPEPHVRQAKGKAHLANLKDILKK